MATPILDGVRIVEIGSGLAVPVATRMLAEAGADVVKIEPPEGDPTRAHAAFASWNRSKRSVVLDISGESDREALSGLLDSVDVFVHDLRPGRAGQLGLDDVALRERHPHLIVSSVTGYPVDHPDRGRGASQI